MKNDSLLISFCFYLGDLLQKNIKGRLDDLQVPADKPSQGSIIHERKQNILSHLLNLLTMLAKAVSSTTCSKSDAGDDGFLEEKMYSVDTFENAQWRKVEQMQSMRLCMH